MGNRENQWSQIYRDTFDRNEGVLSYEEQERLRQAKVALLGLGGIGGPCFEVLVRSGVGQFSIVDKDVFERSNFNRQNLAVTETLGQKKIDVAESFAKSINEEVKIQKFITVTEDNAEEILGGCRVAVHAIDSLKPCVIASRTARKKGIPIVEGWALPFGNVRVLTSETPSLEELYRLPTVGKSVESIPDEVFREYEKKMIEHLGASRLILDHYQDGAMESAKAGRTPSFAPMAWLSSVLMAIETVKIIIGRGRIPVGRDYVYYDPYEHVQRKL